MLHEVDGLQFESPFGFLPEATTVTLRAAEAPGAASRPNLVVHRRPAAGGATVAACAAAVSKELAATLPGVGPIDSAEIVFADGARGVVLSYAFGESVAQLQALRLDGGTLTTLTATLRAGDLTDGRRRELLATLATARAPAPRGR